MRYAAAASRVSLDGLIEAAQFSDLDDTPAMNEIIRRFQPLARRLARQTTKSEHLHDDLMNAARIALVKAVRRHNPQQVGFPAFAETYMRGAARREYQRWLPPVTENDGNSGSPFEPLMDEEDPADIVIYRFAPWGDAAVAAAMDKLSPAQQRITHLRYVEDASLERIAGESGTTSSAVSQRLSTIHRALAVAIA